MRYFQNPPEMRVRLFEGELLPGLRYLRNLFPRGDLIKRGELLLGLPYLRNQLFGFGGEKAVNYCLIYGTSETTARA